MTTDTFAMLAGSILTSSIWSEDDKTRIVWITLLALKDKDGWCATSLPGLAALARVAIEDTEKAIAKLEAPDKHSQTPTDDGRRIVRMDGGWFIINHAKFRDIERAEKRRAYMRDFMANKRMLADVSKPLDPLYVCASVSAVTSSKVAHGELGKVLLSAEEYKKLQAAHSFDELAAGIEILDTYIASKNPKYASHYAVMKTDSWVWERVKEKRSTGSSKAAARPDPDRLYDDTLIDIVQRFEKTMPTDIGRALCAFRDKYKDFPKNRRTKQDVVSEAYEIFKGRREGYGIPK
jgi:hypothetical protein